MRVILDRSAFREASFEYFSRELLRLSERRKISVYITPSLIDETVRNFLLAPDKNTRDLIRKQYKFLLDLSENRWFEDNFKIIKTELQLFPRRKNYFFHKNHYIKVIRNNLMQYVKGAIPQDREKEYFLGITNQNNSKKQQLKRNSNDIRLSYPKFSKLPKGKDVLNVMKDWSIFKNMSLEAFSIGLIKQSEYFPKIMQEFIIRRWLNNKEKFPFFNEWASGMLYISYYALYVNQKIDFNAQSDIHNLIYLNYVDAIFSEEKGFMFRAWQDLYKSKNKQYLSVADLKNL